MTSKKPAGEPARPGLRLRLTAAAESIVRRGHPWVFAQSVRSENRPGQTGELAVIFDRADKFLAVGLYDAQSPIRVRVLHRGKPLKIDAAWWAAQAAAAAARRKDLFDSNTDGFRVVNGESENFPGLVVDQYAGTRVLKIYTAAWLPRLTETAALFRGTERTVLRLSRNIQETARVEFDLSDGLVLHGPPLDGPVIFRENGLRFEADVLRGQKTGFFLDQRDNRREVEALAAGRDTLNLFSYSGGFSLYAARGGAASVTSLDLSEHALAGARRNFALNSSEARIAACPHETIQADAFGWLRSPPPRKFGLIIIDPPSLAKREADKPEALAAYKKLIESGIALLDRKGILVAASCSAHVTAEEFCALARTAAAQAGAPCRELRVTGHPPDHPATFPEGEYLKCVYFERVD